MSEQIEVKPIGMCEKGHSTRMAFINMPTELTRAVYQYHVLHCGKCWAWFDGLNAQAQKAEYQEVSDET